MANAAPTDQTVDITTGRLATKGKGVDSSKSKNEDKQLYINDVNPFEFMRHADNGTGGFLFGQYLTQHSRERDFKERRNYSYFLNFTKRIISALVNPCFREEPVRKDKKENVFFAEFLLNCDRRGHTFNKFMKKVARKVKRYGVYFVVVENDRPEDMPANKGEAKAKGQYPYVYCYSPEYVDSYDWDDLGRLERIVFREWLTSKSAKNAGQKVWMYREWTAEGWILWEDQEEGGQKKRVKVDEGAITIGRIPVIPIYAEEPEEDDDPIMPHPPLYHIARTNLAIFDVCSELRELERNQMFSLLRIPTSPGKPLAAVEIGTKNAIGFDGSSTHPPDFMSPDAAIPTAIMEDRKFLIEQLFEMASLVGIVGMVAKEESGRAREMEFQSTREALTEFGHALESAEMQIVDLFQDYLGEEIEFEVNYSENFGIIDMTAETAKAAESLALNVSPEVNAEIKKDWVLKAFRDSAAELIQQLIESIDVEKENEIFSKAAERKSLETETGADEEEDSKAKEK